MAFYSIRVDDEGREIETTRKTYRNLNNTDSLDNVSIKGTARCENSVVSSSKPSNSYKTIRYVNSATFIETSIRSEKKSSDEDKDKQEQKEELIEEEENLNSDSIDSSSSDSINNTHDDSQYQTHMEAIPLLELNSNESFPSSNNITYSYRKVSEITKMIKKPDAYKEWLDAKRSIKLYEKKLKLEKEKNDEEEKRQRKILADQKFQEWKEKKLKNCKSKEKIQITTTTTLAEKPEEKQKTTSGGGKNKTISEKERLENEKNFKAWLEKKMRVEKSIKEKNEEDIKREKELEQKRREQSAAVYQDWLKLAPSKPKPVPLNRGLLTLKGSMSEIYVNPIPWTTIDTCETSSLCENLD